MIDFNKKIENWKKWRRWTLYGGFISIQLKMTCSNLDIKPLIWMNANLLEIYGGKMKTEIPSTICILLIEYFRCEFYNYLNKIFQVRLKYQVASFCIWIDHTPL